MMEQTDQELQQQCIRQSLSEIDCGLLKYTYAAGIALNTKVVQASANGKLVTCATCQDKDNGFVVNQVGNIGWFASTMMKLIESIHS